MDKKKLVNTVFYLVKTGCQWRQLPHDFTPYSTVHSFFRRARLSGLLDNFTRLNAGRNSNPTYAIIDSQSVKTTSESKYYQ